MLRIVSRMQDLNFSSLCAIYEEYLSEIAATQYHREDHSTAMLLARQDFYQYLKTSFFATPKAYYAIWSVNGKDVSALRLEPYRKGYLLAALETLPSCRKKGYATSLIHNTLSWLAQNFVGTVYSHIAKDNLPSLMVHQACGFQITSDSALYLDGSFSRKSYTLQYQITIASDVET